MLSAFVTVLSISCNKDSDLTPPKAISFGKVATRAALSDIQDKGFGVWTFINNAEYTTKHLLMNNVYVYYDGGAWEYSPEEYWIADTRFSFVATYPYDEAGTNFKLDSDSGAVMLSVSETPSEVDYLMATAEVDTAAEGFDPGVAVDLQFKHMLTSVSLNIWRDGGKHQNDQMRIRKVTLSNICKGGTYSSALKAWTPTSDKLTLSYENNNLSDSDNIGAVIIKDGTLEAGGGDPLTPLFAEQQQPLLLLIPQTIGDSNSVSLKIEYELKRQNAAEWESAELETILPDITWESGRQYTYNVVLSSVTDITVYYIQTKVDPWGTPQVGGTVIIK